MMNHLQRTPPVRQSVHNPRTPAQAGCSRRHAVGGRAIIVVWLVTWTSGCGLFGSGQQLKQLQMENDRLISEYRAQRERVTKLQETNVALEARIGEAERLLAQAGKTLPSSRISRAPQRSSSGATASSTGGATSQAAPPYIPPSVPSLPESGAAKPSSSAGAAGEVEWRPMRRQ